MDTSKRPQEKRCAVCSQTVDGGLLQCPKCGSGVFKTEKASNDSTMINVDSKGIGTINVKHILILIFSIFYLIGLPFFEYHFLSSRPIENASGSDVLSADGVFRPGGFIRLRISTDKNTPEGLYQGTVVVEPVLSETQKQNGIEWPVLRKNVGEVWGWGNTISSGFGSMDYTPIDFDVILDIPRISSLSKETIPIVVRADLIYPSTAKSGPYFTNRALEISEKVAISIKGSQLSAWESVKYSPIKGGVAGTALTVFFVVCVILWFFTLGFIINYLVKRKKKNPVMS